MALLRNPLQKDFTQIPNELITDIRLSQGAFRVICLLFSKPDGWKVFNSAIQKELGIKKTDTLSKYWKEAEETNWISRVKITDPKEGVVGAYDYTLNLSPKMVDTPEDGVHQNGDYPQMVEHSNTNSSSNTNKSNKKSIKKENNRFGHFSQDEIDHLENSIKSNGAILTIDQVKDFFNYRKKIKVPVKTISPLISFVKQIAEINKAGISTQDAIQAMLDSEWRTVKLDYLSPKKANQKDTFDLSGKKYDTEERF